MNTDANLRNLKDNIYKSFSQDGLWEILFGFFMLMWGIAVQTDMGLFPGPSFVILYIVVLLLKRRITYPRIGYVKFAENNKRSGLRSAFLVTVLFNVVFYILYINQAGNIQRSDLLFIFGMLTAVAICLIAFWWRVGRLFAFAGMVLAAFGIYQGLHTPAIFSFIVPGSIILVCGIVLLYRFIHKYPRLDREGQDENR